ncbi:Sperm-associated antigen 17 [Varanus komodoensis]|nr:Sperm-associated antigen 17 [Varanus komodoensis]
MRKAGLDESPVGIKIARRNISDLRYADDTTLTAESEEELKSLLMRVKEESAKVGLKLSIRKTKIMASGPITSCQIDGEEMEVVTDFIFLSSKITADGDCSQEIKRHLLLGRKAMANLDSILKSRDITLLTKVHIVKAMVFPIAMYGCESWTIRNAEHRRIEVLELCQEGAVQLSLWETKLAQARQEREDGKKCLMRMRDKIIPPYFRSEFGMAFLEEELPDVEHFSKLLPPFTKKEKKELLLANITQSNENRSVGNDLEARDHLARSKHPGDVEPNSLISFSDHAEICQDLSATDAEVTETRLEILFQRKLQSLLVDAAGSPRKEKVKLPSSIQRAKPQSVPRKKGEDPVSGRVHTCSVAAASQQLSGFLLIPPKVTFGVLKEGCTYAATVALKNVGMDFCRFRVKQPPRCTGLRVSYTPGPVAAGLQTELEVEIYAMAIGVKRDEGMGRIFHKIEIYTETETLFLPVEANILYYFFSMVNLHRMKCFPPVLTPSHYECRPPDYPQGEKASSVRLVSGSPGPHFRVILPHKLPS